MSWFKELNTGQGEFSYYEEVASNIYCSWGKFLPVCLSRSFSNSSLWVCYLASWRLCVPWTCMNFHPSLESSCSMSLWNSSEFVRTNISQFVYLTVLESMERNMYRFPSILFSGLSTYFEFTQVYRNIFCLM